MSGPVKWTIVSVFLIAFLCLGAFGYLKHESNVRTVQEVKLALASSNIGNARDGDEPSLSKDAVSNLITEVVESEKNNGNDIRIKYVFLDKENNLTTNPENANSIQFKIELLNKNKVVSTSVSRLVLKEI
ncbi:hypothetical protein [Bacillus sp. FSL M8-0168]|uniref:hypothetical protein n=1 Tax=Bacillus sp. FSL M8-0168 TaxID=2921614 RepID=UPI0030FDCDD8